MSDCTAAILEINIGAVEDVEADDIEVPQQDVLQLEYLPSYLDIEVRYTFAAVHEAIGGHDSHSFPQPGSSKSQLGGGLVRQVGGG